MAISVPTTRLRLDRVIRHFRSTANSKKDHSTKLAGFKSFRIQNSHFRFRIQNLRRHDQTGEFLFRIRSLSCKRQNQFDTKKFRIHQESGTISSSVNPVFKKFFDNTRN